MRLLSTAFIVVATPAAAHHEIVVATFAMPVTIGVPAIAAVILVTVRKWWGK